jgi:hypothetical protein
MHAHAQIYRTNVLRLFLLWFIRLCIHPCICSFQTLTVAL